jgi:cell division protein FtsB
MWTSLLKVIKNRYLIATLAFLAFIGFFDQNNIINQYQLHQDLKELERERDYYIQEIKKDRKTTQELKTNLRNLETFGREKYLMKKDDEDVFVIYKEEEQP